MTQFVKSRTLAAWLQFTTDTVKGWSAEGKLDRHFLGGVLHHSEESVNAMFASANRGMPKPPVVNDLRSGVKLLTLAQAAEILGIQPSSFQSKLNRKRFVGLYFANEWRFTDEAIYAYKHKRSGYMTKRTVMHLFGCSQTVLHRWEQAGILEPVHVPGAGYWRNYYRPQDVLQTVQLCLPVWAKHSATRWVQELSASQEPALTTTHVMQFLGLTRPEVLAMADAKQLFWLSLKDDQGDRRFSPASVWQTFLKQKPLTPEDIAFVIGASTNQIYRWLKGKLACPIHNQDKLEHRYACMVAILKPLLSPGLTPRNWLAGRKMSDKALLTMQDVARHYRVSVDDIVLMAQSGQLGGLRRPDGVWMFSVPRLEMSRAEVHAWLTRHSQQR